MAGRIKIAKRSSKTRDKAGMYRNYVYGQAQPYGSGNYDFIHRLSGLFRHQGR